MKPIVKLGKKLPKKVVIREARECVKRNKLDEDCAKLLCEQIGISFHEELMSDKSWKEFDSELIAV